ncbi:MAG: hypothetical protein ABFE13_04870, partial [Phycisphaerales bacterium]
MDRAKTVRLLGVFLLSAATSAVFAGVSPREVIDAAGATHGICVVAGDQACDLAIALVRESDLLIYLHVPKAEDLESARKTVD